MELKDGMFVICPKGDVAPYLTNGKKYEVFDVEKQKNRIQYSFKIKNDKGEIVSPCLISDYYGCSLLYDKHWIISKD